MDANPSSFTWRYSVLMFNTGMRILTQEQVANKWISDSGYFFKGGCEWVRHAQ